MKITTEEIKELLNSIEAREFYNLCKKYLEEAKNDLLNKLRNTHIVLIEDTKETENEKD